MTKFALNRIFAVSAPVFFTPEYTPKNSMIVGTEKKFDAEKLDEEINSMKNFYGISEQKLEKLLSN